MKIPDYNKKIKHPTYLEMQKEIERLNNIIEKYKKHLEDIDKWLDYNTEIGNLYWYDSTPFPELEIDGSDKE